MTPSRWREIDRIFDEVLARDPQERSAYLREACPDDAMRADIEALLAHHDSASPFLAGSPLDLLAPSDDDRTVVGPQLGVYRIIALIGMGGMGAVYRALDTRLQREVAIKILPRALTSHPERLASFQREAQLLASLSHPNICTIHGIDEVDGTSFLILELVDGATLAQTIAARRTSPGLPLPDVLEIGRQIVDALATAHDKGIVHRDLKPANIMVTPGGTTKLLDFGLARAVAAGSAPPDLTGTLGPGAGGEGAAVMGTAAYMSPEQARGLSVDKRTDIWAFGCVLFEMASGHTAFAGDTPSESLARVLEREPDWSLLPSATPPSIRRLLRRTLVKDYRRRLRDIGDARLDLDDAAEAREGPGVDTPAAAHARPRIIAPWVACMVLGVAVLVREVTRPPEAALDPLAGARFTQLTNWSGTEGAAAISPDGRFVGFIADRDGEFDLWRHQVGTDTFQNLTADTPPLDPPGIFNKAGFSADGAELWFSAIGQRPRLLPQTGGTARPFLSENARSLTWSTDGRRVAYFAQREYDDDLSIADSSGADARPITVTGTDGMRWSGDAADPMHNHNPVWSRDDKWIYFVRGRIRQWNQNDHMDLWRIPASGGTPEQLTRLGTVITFVTVLDWRTLLFIAVGEDGSGPALWALDVVTKQTRRVSSGLEQYTSVAASHDGGRIVATRTERTSTLWSVPILPTPAGEDLARPYAVQVPQASAPRFGGPSLFYLSNRGVGEGLWVSSDGQSTEILRRADGILTSPAAPSPDGRRIAITRVRDGLNRLTLLARNGTDVRTLAPTLVPEGAPEWSPDGSWIVTGGRDEAGPGLFKVSVDGGGPTRLASGAAANPIWSPDGRLIVYAGAFGLGQVRLHAVRPDGTAESLPAVRVRPGGYRFLRDGSGIVFLPRPESHDFSLFDFRTGRTRVVTGLKTRGELRSFDIAPDGRSIVFDRSLHNSDIVLIERPVRD